MGNPGFGKELALTCEKFNFSGAKGEFRPEDWLEYFPEGWSPADASSELYSARRLIADFLIGNCDVAVGIPTKGRAMLDEVVIAEPALVGKILDPATFNPEEETYHGAVELAGKRVVLVDDTIQTGNTCEKWTRVLRNAGVDSVTVIALAVQGSVFDGDGPQGAPDRILTMRVLQEDEDSFSNSFVGDLSPILHSLRRAINADHPAIHASVTRPRLVLPESQFEVVRAICRLPMVQRLDDAPSSLGLEPVVSHFTVLLETGSLMEWGVPSAEALPDLQKIRLYVSRSKPIDVTLYIGGSETSAFVGPVEGPHAPPESYFEVKKRVLESAWQAIKVALLDAGFSVRLSYPAGG